MLLAAGTSSPGDRRGMSPSEWQHLTDGAPNAAGNPGKGTTRTCCHPGVTSLGDTYSGMVPTRGMTSARDAKGQGWCQPWSDTSPGVALAKATWGCHQAGTCSG